MDTLPTLDGTSQAVGSDPDFALQLQSILPALRRFTRRLAKNDTVGDDLAQDTLVRAWSNQHRFERGTNFRAWIFRIARNHFLSGARRNRRHIDWNPATHENLLIALPSQEDSIYESDLDTAMSALPAAQRQALILVNHQGLSYAAAAHRLGIEPNTLRSRLARGRASVIAYFSDVPPKRPSADFVELGANPDRDARQSGQSTYNQWKRSERRVIG